MKILVSGSNGQDGAFLCNLLVKNGHEVFATVRRGSTKRTPRLQYFGLLDKITLVNVELTEFANVSSVIKKIKPDMVFNLAAQSFVADSFDHPHLTNDINYYGLLNILEALRLHDIDSAVYQASTSEMFGAVVETPQRETTRFNPMSPYAVSKAASHYLIQNYRKAYGMRAFSGILFNHESELRGREFVTRKITSQLAELKFNNAPAVELGNLSATRDWGYAGDYVEAMFKINSQNLDGEDFVVATNTSKSIREFLTIAAEGYGFNPKFNGEGMEEQCICAKTGKLLAKINPKFFRPSEVETLQGDYSKIENKLGWVPTTTFELLVEKMIKFDSDVAQTKNNYFGAI